MLHGRARPFSRTAARPPDAPTQAETTSWAAQVVTNGGTVSAGRFVVVNNFIAAEKTAGTWALTDDYWGLWGENAPQALTSLKQLRLVTAVAAPTFTVDRGYAGDAVASYLNTNWIASTHAVAMTGTDMRYAAYEPTNSASGQTFGVQVGATQSLSSIGRSGTTTLVQLNCNNVVLNLPPVATSAGYTSASRAGGGTTVNGYKNGVAMAPGTAVTPGAVLPNIAMYICARNVAGVASQFGTRVVSFLCVGAPLSAAQETAQYNNVQAWATAVGANV